MNSVLMFLRRLAGFVAAVMTVAVAGIVILLAGTYGVIYAYFDGTAELPADCALVFGAAVYAQNQPGPAITRRVAAAATLYNNEQVQTLILSGGRGEGVRHSEAQVMRALAIELGVQPQDIILEDQSHSTWENIAYAKNLTSQCSSVVGVSDPYHLARIELLSWRQGWGELGTVPATVPVADRPPRYNDKPPLREIFAYIYYVLYIDLFLPDLPEQLEG